MKKIKFMILPVVFIAFAIIVSCITLITMGEEYLEKNKSGFFITDSETHSTNQEIDQTKPNLFHRIEALNNKIISKIDLINDGFEGKLQFKNFIVGISSLFDYKVLGERQIEGYVIDNEGIIQSPKDVCDVTFCSEQLIALQCVCDENEVKMLFVMPPTKNIQVKTVLPDGITDNSNINSDNLLRAIDGTVKHIDLRVALSDYLKTNNAFYVGDHHWTIKSSFKAYQFIAQYISENTGLSVDTENLDESLYIYKRLEDAFIGYQTRKLGALLTGYDDFEYIYPSFETKYTLTQQINGKVVDQRIGRFEDTLIYSDMFIDTPSEGCYDSYLKYGNTEKIILNDLTSNDLKLLVIGDSFSRPTTCFLSSLFRETRTIDTQYSHPSIHKYIEDYKPDLVIVMINSAAIGTGYVQSYDFD